jgi:hypothetical protein
VEDIARSRAGNGLTLSANLLAMSEAEIVDLVLACHGVADGELQRPALFDGAGKQYAHRVAVYYFFAWLLRDAPTQRLRPILARAQKLSGRNRAEAQRLDAEALAKLFVAYRGLLGTFEWAAVREVFVDRLEGSRRAIRGRAAEIPVRTALSAALQAAYEDLDGYGRFAGVRVPDGEITVRGETFDVSVELLDASGDVAERVLIPVKSRETEGGGHSNLFTRDIEGAMRAIRAEDVEDRVAYWLAAFIIAENWAPEQTQHVVHVCDFAVALTMNPTEFETLDAATQDDLHAFIRGVLSGSLERKAGSSRGTDALSPAGA